MIRRRSGRTPRREVIPTQTRLPGFGAVRRPATLIRSEVVRRLPLSAELCPVVGDPKGAHSGQDLRAEEAWQR